MSKRNSAAAKARRRQERQVRTAKVPAPAVRQRQGVCPTCGRGPVDLLPVTGICAKCFDNARANLGI